MSKTARQPKPAWVLKQTANPNQFYIAEGDRVAVLIEFMSDRDRAKFLRMVKSGRWAFAGGTER
jgi:hypothetical protein